MAMIETLGQAYRRQQTNAKADAFVDVARAMMLSEALGGAPVRHAEAESMARPVVEYLRTAVPGMADSDLGLEPMVAGWIETLSNSSAFDALLAGGAHVVPLHSRFGILIGNATGASVARGQGKPVATMTVGNTTLDEQKAVALVVLSNETLRFGTAVRALIDNALRQSVASATDTVFVPALIAATSPIASTGLAAADVLHDIRLLLDAISVDSGSRLHLILGADVAKRLSVISTTTGAPAFAVSVSGGTLAGIPVSVSDAADDAVVLVDARALAMASDAIRLRSSTAAALEMDTAPSMSIATGSPEAPVESNVVSLFQTNSTALVAERFFGFSVVRASGVASLSGVQWGLVGSPPA